jgi:O-antigen ligase
VAFFLGVAYILMGFNGWLVQRILRWMLSRFKVRPSPGRRSVGPARLWLLKTGLSLVITLTLMGGYVASLRGLAVVASRYDYRIAQLFAPQDPASWSSIFEIASHLAFAERVVYWATGWEIFNHHPILGVGLGNAGFYFQEEIPSFGYLLTEINDLFFRLNYLPNTKSLWSRLAAETGLVGLAFFAAWLYVLWQSARFLRRSENRLEQTFGLAGSLTLVILMVEGFSIDSFALPYLWFSLGLLTAAASLRQKKLSAARTPMASGAEIPSGAGSLRQTQGGTT